MDIKKFRMRPPGNNDYDSILHPETSADIVIFADGTTAESQKLNYAEHKADYIQHTPYAIATGNDSYAVSIPRISSLAEGMSVKIKFTNANTGASTLNINGLGAKPIQKSNGNALSSGNIKAGQICHLVYTGSVFQLLGEGGEYGNVTPSDVIKGVEFGTEEGIKEGTLELTGTALTSDVLSGKSFYTTNPKSKQTGTMTNRGAVSKTITTQSGSYTIPKGYHNGRGKVTANFANLTPDNVKAGVNIGGVVGTLEGGIVKSNSSYIRYTYSDVGEYEDAPEIEFSWDSNATFGIVLCYFTPSYGGVSFEAYAIIGRGNRNYEITYARTDIFQVLINTSSALRLRVPQTSNHTMRVRILFFK